MINGLRRPKSKIARGTRLFLRIMPIGCKRVDQRIGCRGNRRRNSARNPAEASAGLSRQGALRTSASGHTDSSLKADKHFGCSAKFTLSGRSSLMVHLLGKSTEEVKHGHQPACAHRREQMQICLAGHVSAGRYVRPNTIERRSKQQPANAALLKKIERDRSGRATPPATFIATAKTTVVREQQTRTP